MAQQPHFEISAAVVRQLGEELVTDEVTALVELVKNAYDADATYAHVVVDTEGTLNSNEFRYSTGRGFITIEDDGFGMNEADITNGWLTISLSRKREMKAKKLRTEKGRTPLGDKGLGRLSTQKLGRNLEMLTRKPEAAEGLHVSFQWDAFTDDKSLSQVPVEVEPTKVPRKAGTTLAISNLRSPDVWKDDAAERLVRDLSQIISPFSEVRPFLVTLKINGRPVDLAQISARVRDAAVGRFDFRYDNQTLTLSGKIRLAKLRGNQSDVDFERLVGKDNGAAFSRFLEKRKGPVSLRFDTKGPYFAEFDHSIHLQDLGRIQKSGASLEADGTSSALADPGPFHGQIDDFVFRADLDTVRLSGLSNASEIVQIVKQHAGIKVFRDGFAVKPYGINGQDWLGLSAQQTSATSWYGLRPQNALGFVAISEAINTHLKDKTDREGFVANPWSKNFQRLMVYTVEFVAETYEWIRRSYNLFKAEAAEAPGPFASGREVLTDAENVSKQLATYATRATTLEARLSSARQQIATVTARIEAEPLLSTAAERQLSELLANAQQSLQASEAIFAELVAYADQAQVLTQIVAVLNPRLEVVSDQLAGFAELAGLGLLAETLAHEVQNQTDRLMQKASAAIARARKASPENTELRLFGQDVVSTASALRRQIGHLTPSLRYQRDRIDVFPIGELLADIKQHFADRWESDAFAGSLTLSGSDFPVSTNRGRLTQVIDNILLNSEYWLKDRASRTTAFEPEIHIETTMNGLRIWDNGPGISTSIEDSIFEPFVTLKPKDQGRGLGLFISTQIMDSLGCSLSLSDERNADGRRYIFELDLSGIVHGK